MEVLQFPYYPFSSQLTNGAGTQSTREHGMKLIRKLPNAENWKDMAKTKKHLSMPCLFPKKRLRAKKGSQRERPLS